MNKFIKKIILLILFVLCCTTLLLTWVNNNNIQVLNGTSILTGNLFLTVIIFACYGISILFYDKAKKVFFCMGLSSLSMLFALMFSKFETWGRFSNNCVGPYLGLLSVILTIIAYVWLNAKDNAKSNE